ncbi:tRNA pseudouridine(38-40) synthase TruA [Dyella sp. M7H15-1]|uniref:tRNA pseudouridine(38-40) synthase TruA n=1 Tax=Dyella sp. M7H15-1 TaxID=2501295 RepID=UPI0010050495|nr:tRNA pseudouridine(38-40) synthase TruA [Dyella sp. M7H15-1]QAU23461.1 tRNA pseudouridine(38-40) synthase TruA [Dyella sp. M7H15-1]
MRIALGIEYDGTDFLGWQRLSHGVSVQGSVERALSFVAAEPIEVTCAGRTDAGVHGRCQVIHLDTHVQRDMRGWVLGTCSNLPISVAVLWAQPVPDDFHARFSARSRRYRYTILNRSVRPALDARYVTWERHPLDAKRMHVAAQALIGEHDFSAFRAVSCQAAHARREVKALKVWREEAHVIVEIEASAFLHHMVRNIVGSLLLVGRGEESMEWVTTLLAGRNREMAGPTAAASGLTFIGPRYERHWNLPVEVSE